MKSCSIYLGLSNLTFEQLEGPNIYDSLDSSVPKLLDPYGLGF